MYRTARTQAEKTGSGFRGSGAIWAIRPSTDAELCLVWGGMMKTLALVGVLVGMSGCGGGGGGVGGPVTYQLASDVADDVSAGDCVVVSGPNAIGTGTTQYEVNDNPGTFGADAMELAIVPDATWTAEGCSFATSETVVDKSFTGSDSDGGPIAGGVYDFVVFCQNAIQSCNFDLNWTATY